MTRHTLFLTLLVAGVAGGQETYKITGTIEIGSTAVEITGGQVVLTQEGETPPPPPPSDLNIFLGGMQLASEIDKALAAKVDWKGKQLQWPAGFAGEINTVEGFRSWMAKIADVQRPTYISLTNEMSGAIDVVTSHPQKKWIIGMEVEERSGGNWTKAKFEELARKSDWPVYAFARMQTVVPNHPNRSHMNYSNYAAGTAWKTPNRQVPIEPRSDRLASMQRWLRASDGRLGSMHVTGFGQTWERGPWDREREALACSMSTITWMMDQAKKAGCSNVMFWGTRQARGGQLLLTWDRNPQLWSNLVVAADAFLRSEVIDYLPGRDAKLIEIVP